MSVFLRSLLAHRNYEAVLATPSIARAILQQERSGIDVVVTNTPFEFTATPDVPLLYLAATPVPEALQGFRRAQYLAKPFHPRELFECLRDLLA